MGPTPDRPTPDPPALPPRRGAARPGAGGARSGTTPSAPRRPGARHGPSPAQLQGFRRGAEWALAAATALELGLFEALAAGPRSAEALARHLSLDTRGVRILLGVLADLGLVRDEPRGATDGDGARADGGPGDGRSGPAWALTGQARARFVDRDAPDHEAPALRQWLAGIRRWADELPDAVRRGRPPDPRGKAGEAWEDEAALTRFMAAMDAKEPSLVEAVAARTLEGLPEPGRSGAPRVLDLGGGPGTFSRAFLRHGARVVLADRPEVVDHVVGAYGLDSLEGLELWRGDFLESLPDGPFDAALLANITHIFDADTNAALVRRVAGILRPGGVLAVVDFVRNVSGFAALFAVTMLLNTERGDTHRRADYEAWFRAAGLGPPRLVSLDPDRQLLLARRRDG